MGRKREKRVNPFHVSPSHYVSFREELFALLEPDLDSFACRYLRDSIESKLLDPDFSDPPDVRRQRAIDKWLSVEENNRHTNSRVMFADETDILFLTEKGTPITADMILEFARRLIKETIGVQVDWDSLAGSFSNGASTSQRRGPGCVPRKYQGGIDITEGAIPHFRRLNTSVHWQPEQYNVVPGNVMFTVPKTTTVDRVACKEPDLNMYVQKAIGDYFRQALKRKGIDLNDQTINQRLAYEGSVLGSLATVDLSSASDSVTTQLVTELLPFEWSSLLMDLRSPYTIIDGELHENEMISSMGNAFTFELESLIFWALTRSVCYHSNIRGRVSVYGDDIICPSSAAPHLQKTLSFFGFQFNTEKSFWEGKFRESCGKHYFDGSDVTPFYIRKVPSDVTDWIHILNSLRAWLDRQAIIGILDGRYYDLWKKYSLLIPEPVKGGHDTARRDILVSYGQRPLARITPKQGRAVSSEKRYQLGSYLQWLNTAEGRENNFSLGPRWTPLWGVVRPGDGTPSLSVLATSVFTVDAILVWERIPKLLSWSRPIFVFPQELGLDIS